MGARSEQPNGSNLPCRTPYELNISRCQRIFRENFANTNISGMRHRCDYSFSNGGEGLEKEARAAKQGLWADPQPVPP